MLFGQVEAAVENVGAMSRAVLRENWSWASFVEDVKIEDMSKLVQVSRVRGQMCSTLKAEGHGGAAGSGPSQAPAELHL